jgi:methylmalonyl-CoA/ethylmalonyl-CoA epimerase
MQKRLHHLGWAVASIADSLPVWSELLGLPDLGFESFPGLDVQFFAAGECMIELLESSGGDATVDAVLERNGGGLHHLAFGVPDVAAALEDCAKKGLELLDQVPRLGARGTMIGFIDPHWPDGTLVEFVQDPTWQFD